MRTGGPCGQLLWPWSRTQGPSVRKPPKREYEFEEPLWLPITCEKPYKHLPVRYNVYRTSRRLTQW
jgi:hypothetical protein